MSQAGSAMANIFSNGLDFEVKFKCAKTMVNSKELQETFTRASDWEKIGL